MNIRYPIYEGVYRILTVIGLSPYRVDYSIYISAFSLLILRKAYSRYRNKSLS